MIIVLATKGQIYKFKEFCCFVLQTDALKTQTAHC